MIRNTNDLKNAVMLRYLYRNNLIYKYTYNVLQQRIINNKTIKEIYFHDGFNAFSWMRTSEGVNFWSRHNKLVQFEVYEEIRKLYDVLPTIQDRRII